MTPEAQRIALAVPLKPCPFCGGEAAIERFGTGRMSTIVACTNCGCRLECNESFNHGSIWNTRHDSQPALTEQEHNKFPKGRYTP